MPREERQRGLGSCPPGRSAWPREKLPPAWLSPATLVSLSTPDLGGHSPPWRDRTLGAVPCPQRVALKSPSHSRPRQPCPAPALSHPQLGGVIFWSCPFWVCHDPKTANQRVKVSRNPAHLAGLHYTQSKAVRSCTGTHQCLSRVNIGFPFGSLEPDLQDTYEGCWESGKSPRLGCGVQEHQTEVLSSHPFPAWVWMRLPTHKEA